MTAASQVSTGSAGSVSRERLTWLASVVFCGVLPVVVLVGVYVQAIRGGSAAMDFRQFYRGAVAILDGVNPYPADGARRCLGAAVRVSTVPSPSHRATHSLSLNACGRLAMTATILVVPAILLVLGVRDWRCYGIAFLWPPVISAIQTG